MSAFVVDSAVGSSQFGIYITEEVTKTIGVMINGSYNVLGARLFGLKYPDYLRMVRDNYEADLKGKEKGYITFYFSDKVKANKLCAELNKRWNTFSKQISSIS